MSDTINGIKKKGKRGNPKGNPQYLMPPWKKGQSGNPEGGRAHDPIKRAMAKFTKEYFHDLINIAVMGNLAELQKIAVDPNSPAIKVGVAKCLADAVVKGDWDLLEKIIQRIIGKVPDKVDVTSNGESVGGAVQYIVKLPANGREAKKTD